MLPMHYIKGKIKQPAYQSIFWSIVIKYTHFLQPRSLPPLLFNRLTHVENLFFRVKKFVLVFGFLTLKDKLYNFTLKILRFYPLSVKRKTAVTTINILSASWISPKKKGKCWACKMDYLESWPNGTMARIQILSVSTHFYQPQINRVVLWCLVFLFCLIFSKGSLRNFMGRVLSCSTLNPSVTTLPSDSFNVWSFSYKKINCKKTFLLNPFLSPHLAISAYCVFKHSTYSKYICTCASPLKSTTQTTSGLLSIY